MCIDTRQSTQMMCPYQFPQHMGLSNAYKRENERNYNEYVSILK